MAVKRNLLWSAGGLASAVGVFLTWLCCLLPMTLGAAGMGAAALGSKLEPYRPLLIGVALACLAAAFYQAYRPRNSECAEGEVCATPAGRRRQRLILWMVTLVALLFLTLPYWIGFYYMLAT